MSVKVAAISSSGEERLHVRVPLSRSAWRGLRQGVAIASRKRNQCRSSPELEDAGGPQYFLNGKPLHAGDFLKLRTRVPPGGVARLSASDGVSDDEAPFPWKGASRINSARPHIVSTDQRG